MHLNAQLCSIVFPQHSSLFFVPVIKMINPISFINSAKKTRSRKSSVSKILVYLQYRNEQLCPTYHDPYILLGKKVKGRSSCQHLSKLYVVCVPSTSLKMYMHLFKQNNLYCSLVCASYISTIIVKLLCFVPRIHHRKRITTDHELYRSHSF